MPLEFSNHPATVEAMAKADFGIHQIGGQVSRPVIRFGLRGGPGENAIQHAFHVPAGSGIEIARICRDILRQAVERGMIADEDDWIRRGKELRASITNERGKS